MKQNGITAANAIMRKRSDLAMLLKKLQDSQGFTQREAAGTVGVSVGYWNHLLSGKRRRISTEVFDKIQKAFGVDRDILLRAIRDQLDEVPNVPGISLGSAHLEVKHFTRAQKKTIERIKTILETGSDEDIEDLDRLARRVLATLAKE